VDEDAVTASELLDAVSGFAGHHAPALKRFVPRGQRSKAYAMFYRALPSAGKTAIFARQFRRAADYCERNASPLYAHLLRIAAEDIERGGPCGVVVDAHRSPTRVPPAASSIGFMAAVHRVVLETPGSALEPFYPSAGGAVDLTRVGAAFLEVVSRHQERICELLERPVQLNDVGRCRALLGGFLLVAAQTGLPLRILEPGASAGLNLLWDHYRYEVDGATWGDSSSPVRLVGGFVEGRPPLHLRAEVAERRGCDLRPVDARSSEGRCTLLAHVWADHLDRIDLLRAAFEVNGQVDALVERAEASSWLASQLSAPTPGLATVVFHTGLMEYLEPVVRKRIESTIQEAGAHADSRSPVALLTSVPVADGDGQLQLTVWPGGRPQPLAVLLDPHAREIRWQGPGG
jgi:hypothetical protein